MPQTGMDWWVIAGVIAAFAAIAVAFVRLPRKTTNIVKGGSGNTLKGGDGTTRNVVKNGDNNKLSG